MRFFKGLGRFIWRFMVIFSFIVNLVLIVVLIGAGVLIFEIKKSIADPLIGGLHSTAVGLENATIDWTIPVRDHIPVNLDVALDTDTVVTLVQPVPLTVTAKIDLPGINAYGVDANVKLELPAGLNLPVHLNLSVPVREPALPVSLDVRAIIPIKETQLADPIRNLALLFEPLAIGLHNLPADFNETGNAIGQILRGEKKFADFNLLATDGSGGINPNPYIAWAGYSRTAGVNYTLLDQPWPAANKPIETGIVPPGGIPPLDAQLPERQKYYVNDSTPAQNNANAAANLNASGIAPVYYDGSMADNYDPAKNAGPQPDQVNNTTTEPGTTTDIGIVQEAPATEVPAIGGAEGEVTPVPTTTGDLGIVGGANGG